MATINYWGLSKKGSVTVEMTVTIDQLITAIATDEGLATEHYTVSSLADPSKSSLTFGDSSTTLTQLGLVDGGTVLCTTNQTGSKQERQLQKLAIAAKTRTVDGYTRATLDTTQLPTLYSGNTVVDNANVGGLVVGRPWIAGDPAPVTQDLILFFDSERTDCYPGTGTTIYNLVDNTPSTLGGNCTFSNGVIRLNNNTGNMLTNTARINCQTVTNFRTISLWYRQVSNSAGETRYILDARESVVGGYIYTGDLGPAWAGSTMYEDGGVGVQVNYTEQIGTWRNLTLVNTAPMTDDINLFSRYSNNEGLDVEFGACMIYNRVITYEENLQNFNQFKTRYGL
jgi:hypothetical protein